MVHSEVAALERSYGENELRVRTLISELATEREALANNSQRVSDALKGVGAQVARDISNASNSIDKKLAERGLQLLSFSSRVRARRPNRCTRPRRGSQRPCPACSSA